MDFQENSKNTNQPYPKDMWIADAIELAKAGRVTTFAEVAEICYYLAYPDES